MTEEFIRETVGEEAVSAEPTTPLHEIGGFDSLRHVRLILALETKIGRSLTDDEIDSLKTVGEVRSLLGKEG